MCGEAVRVQLRSLFKVIDRRVNVARESVSNSKKHMSFRKSGRMFNAAGEFRDSFCGFGTLALASLLHQERARAAGTNPLAPKPSHLPGAKAKAVIFLFQQGVLGTGIAFPTVPEGKARIRTIMSLPTNTPITRKRTSASAK